MVDTSDIITEDVVRNIVEEKQRETRQFRRAFRSHSGPDSNSYTFPISEADFEGDSTEIPEGGEYPRATKELGDVRAVYSKFGFEVPITDEAVSDSSIDVELDAMDDMADEEFRRMDRIAFGVMQDNQNADGPVTGGGADGVIEDSDLLTARQRLFDYEFNLQQMEMYVGPDGMTDVTSMSEFVGLSELGSGILESGWLPGGDIPQGLLGVARGIPIYATNTGDLGGGEAFVVDRSAYGYESTRWQRQFSSYREENKDQTVHKVRSREDWVATKPDALVKIET